MPTQPYLDELAAIGRWPIVLVELDLDRCTLEYSVDPCGVDAGLGGTGDLGDNQRCYFTLDTCPVPDTYVKGTRTWRLISKIQPLPPLVHASWAAQLYPLVVEVQPISCEIDFEAGFTRPEKCQVKIEDLGGIDEDGVDLEKCPVFDPDKALHNSSRLGLFLRRLVEQNPNFARRAFRLFRGFNTDTFTTADFEPVWAGSVENITFDQKGVATLHCKDVFSEITEKLPPKLDCVLTADASRTATTFSMGNVSKVTDPDSITGAVVLEVRSSVTGRWERVKVTARDVDAGTVTVVRGRYGTPADPLRAGDTVREVLAYVDEAFGAHGWRPVDIVLDLLNRGGVPAANVDDAQIAAEALWMGPCSLRQVITEPTETNRLIFDVLELFGANLYSDERRKIRLTVPHPPAIGQAVTTVRDTPNVLTDSLETNTNDLARLTHAALLYGFAAGTEGSQGEGYDDIAIAVNGRSVDPNMWGDKPPRTKTIKTKWVVPGDSGFAAVCTIRWSLRLGRAPRRVQWEADLRDAALQLGDIVEVTVFEIQDVHGVPLPTQMRVVKRTWKELHGFQFVAQDLGWPKVGPKGLGRRGFLAPASVPVYGSATADQRSKYSFLGDSNNEVGSPKVDGFYAA